MGKNSKWCDEDILKLCEATMAASGSSIDGADMDSGQFWSKVLANFATKKPKVTDRTLGALEGKWKDVQKQVSIFCSFYKISRKIERSGWKDPDDYVTHAVGLYCASDQNESGHDHFPLIFCWRFLRDYDKFEDVGRFKKVQKKSKKRPRKLAKSRDDFEVSDSELGDVLELGDDVGDGEDIDDAARTIKSEKRPLGSKAAKALEFDGKLRVAMVTAQKSMAKSAERRIEIMDEQNDIAACASDPNAESSIEFFETRRQIALMKARAKLRKLKEAAKSSNAENNASSLSRDNTGASSTPATTPIVNGTGVNSSRVNSSAPTVFVNGSSSRGMAGHNIFNANNLHQTIVPRPPSMGATAANGGAFAINGFEPMMMLPSNVPDEFFNKSPSSRPGFGYGGAGGQSQPHSQP